jgi:hypothetical protein
MLLRCIVHTLGLAGGVSINIVFKPLIDVGRASVASHDVMVRSLGIKAMQCDEIWSFNYAKEE